MELDRQFEALSLNDSANKQGRDVQTPTLGALYPYVGVLFSDFAKPKGELKWFTGSKACINVRV